MQRRRRWSVDGSGDDVGEDCSAVGLTLAPDGQSCHVDDITAKHILLTTPKSSAHQFYSVARELLRLTSTTTHYLLLISSGRAKQ